MVFRLILFCFAAIICSCYRSNIADNNCEQCDIKALVKVQEDPSKRNIHRAFCTLSTNCLNNVEYMEYFNEIIFCILDKKPEFAVSEMKELSEAKKNIVLEMVKNPINDSIDIVKIKERIKLIKCSKSKNCNNAINSLLLALDAKK